MEKPSYVIKSSDNGLWYEFESFGSDKVIKKAVGYYLYNENEVEFAELAFGDVKPDGNIDLKSISDNKDMILVLSTVIMTLYNFFELYPKKTVIFTGSTSSRNRLYRAIISKLFDEEKEYFDICGLNFDNSIEDFQKNKDYLAFQINLKNGKNL